MWNSAVNDRPSFWLQVFCNSKVNGAPYWGDKLPSNNWAWPTDTYLQRRLRYVRSEATHAAPTNDAKPQKRAALPKQLQPSAVRGMKMRRSMVH